MIISIQTAAVKDEVLIDVSVRVLFMLMCVSACSAVQPESVIVSR